MGDTQYKVVNLGDSPAPESPPGWNVRGNAPLERSKFEKVIEAQDHLLGGYRPVLTYHTGGLTTGWLVVDGDPASVDYPDNSTWRVMQRTRCLLAPGAYLEGRAIAISSGSEDTAGLVEGACRFSASLDAGADSDGPTNRAKSIQPSDETYGAVGSADSWDWLHLHHLYLGQYRPDAPLAWGNSKREIWSEDTTASVSFSVQAGARVIAANVTEVPWIHVSAHNTDDTSAHAAVADAQTEHPQESAADGATYEERRYGTHRLLDVAQRQTERLGPIIWTWSSHTEEDTEHSDAEADPVVSPGASFGAIHDSSVTAWSADEPGFAVPCSYAQRDKEAGTMPYAAAVPVRIWAYHETTVGGTLRVQVTARSWIDVDLPVTSGYEWTTATGFLESDPSPDVVRANGICLLKHDTAGGVNLRDVVVEWGHAPYSG